MMSYVMVLNPSESFKSDELDVLQRDAAAL